MSTDARTVTAALRTTHEHFAALVGGLDADVVQRPSHAEGWSIADVCSHVGSGAEISLATLEAALAGRAPLEQDAMLPIWDVWNNRDPLEQVQQAVRADAAYVAAMEGLTDGQLAGARVTMFGFLELDGVGLATMRLPEQALHTWDVAAALDPTARVVPAAVPLILDGLAPLLGFLAKPQPPAWTLAVHTTSPEAALLLTNGEERVTLVPADPADPATDGVLRLTTEALVRLGTGRLDATNADGADLSGRVTMADLHAVFPGY